VSRGKIAALRLLAPRANNPSRLQVPVYFSDRQETPFKISRLNLFVSGHFFDFKKSNIRKK
jgi:hypothetical protein